MQIVSAGQNLSSKKMRREKISSICSAKLAQKVAIYYDENAMNS